MKMLSQNFPITNSSHTKEIKNPLARFFIPKDETNSHELQEFLYNLKPVNKRETSQI